MLGYLQCGKNIDKLYTQTGKVFRLSWELNLLLSCFGLSALYVLAHILKQLTQPAGLASFNRGTGTVLYDRGSVIGSIWEKTRRPLPFTHLAVLFIYVWFWPHHSSCFWLPVSQQLFQWLNVNKQYYSVKYTLFCIAHKKYKLTNTILSFSSISI